MDPGYARSYRDLYEKHWWWRAREDLILATLEKLRPAAGWGRILDVGCGDGLLFERLDALGEVEGIETDPTAVTPGSRWASRIHRRAFDEGFRPSAPYSLVLLLDVLEHLADPRSYLRRAVELLEPSGSIVITVPAFPLLWTSHDVLNRHFVRYTRSSLASLARACGADLVHSRYFFQWLAAVKLAAHFWESLARKQPTTPQVPARPLNDFLYRLSRAEQGLLRRVPVPFGSSLLAVARPSRAGS